jgi:hypothetical protein
MEENPIGGKVTGRLLYREVKKSLKTRVYVDLTRTAVLGLKVMSVKSVLGQVYEKGLLN